ncbi:hypothetical protein N8H74_10750 [Pseudomonas sp. B2M1-30]|uniref:hypothetical protein n=1 Tax=Pseudomonas TaxID=286 RepID=UPI0021CA2384|nr:MULTISPECIES: hypothetical protein [Pseudomonas]MCU0118734.1 hypothetical protein [Pseudomonas sp. B2M1-30]MCU7264120.1 hypothetical protein [Pseudomonas koreensis]
MQHPVRSSARAVLSSARINPAQTTLKEQMSALDLQIVEHFASRPHFHEFVRQAFEKHFPDLAPAPDLLRCFISHGETTPLSAQLSERADASEPATRSDAAADSAAALPGLPPSLMDAVVRRIVSGQSAAYAKYKALFHRASDSGGEPALYSALKPEAFDTFLDQLADAVHTQYTQYLQRYWAKTFSPTDVRSHKQWLVQMRIEQLQTEVALLKSDDLLSAAAVTLFETVLRYPHASARQALEGYRPCVYAVALQDAAAEVMTLHGTFVLTARDPQDAEVGWESAVKTPVARPVEPSANVGRVLLFTPNNGLEEFDSLASLDRELHRRLSHAVEFAALSVLVADKDQARVIALQGTAAARDQLKYLERLDSPFDYAIDSQCRLLQTNLESTFARYVRQGIHADMANLPAAIDRVTDLRHAFAVEPILQARLRKQCQARLTAFLKDASSEDREAWAVALENYTEALASLPEYEGLPSLEQFSDRRELLAYSNRQLRAALEAEHGLKVNPDHIIVHTREPVVPVNPVPSAAPGTSIRDPGEFRFVHRQKTLTEAGLDNVASHDLNFTRFSRLSLKTAVDDKHGQTVLPDTPEKAKAFAPYDGLTLEQVKALIRTTNVGQSYQDFLRKNLITSAAALARKQSYADLVERLMRLEAIEARINGDFMPDRLERGFHWVQAVLDAPEDSDQRKTVEGHRILVEYLQLRGQRVRGVLLFATASVAVGSVVVYTPGASGGRVFHEFRKDQFIADFVQSSSWRDYLLGRIGLASRARVLAILKGQGDVSQVNRMRIAGNLFENAYEHEASFVLNDATAQVTTTQQTNVETGMLIATTAIDVLSMVLPVHVTLPIGIARGLSSVFSAVDLAQINDRAGAAHHIVRALAEFTGGLVDSVMGATRVRPRAPATTNPRALNPKLALRHKPDGLLALPGWEGKGIHYKKPADGVGKLYFLNEGKRWYSIIDEGFEQAWRIRDARKPFQGYYPPIRLDGQGHWEVGTSAHAGLLGGNSPQEALKHLYPFLDDVQVNHVFEAFAFPRGREIELGLSFVEHLRSGMALASFVQYLRVGEQVLRRRLQGLPVAGFSGGGVVSEAPVAKRPRGQPPRVRPSESLPAAPARPLNQKFLDWGQLIDPAEFQLQNAAFGIYRRTGGEQVLRGRDYIKMGERYYSILPAHDSSAPHLAYVFDEGLELNHFAQFEYLLWSDLFSQPRLFRSNDGLWSTSIDLPFEKTITSYVADAFPVFRLSSRHIAQKMFELSNPDGLNASGLAMIYRTLRAWRATLAPADALWDPLSLLPVTPKNLAGQWLLEGYFGLYKRLRLSAEGVDILLDAAIRTGTDESLRALMSERLVASGYEIFMGYRLGSELLFKRPGRPQMFWLSLRRVVGNVIEGSHYVAPRVELMDAPTQVLLNKSRETHELVSLVGGMRTPAAGSSTEIFIIRV